MISFNFILNAFSKQYRKRNSCRVCLHTLRRAAAGQVSFSSFPQVDALLMDASENLRLVQVGFCKEVQRNKDPSGSVQSDDPTLA